MRGFVIVAAMLAVQMAAAQSRPPAQAADAAANTIAIDNFTFQASTVTIAAGTRVTWVNHDDVPHKVVSTEKAFASPVLDTDGRFSYTFTTPGTYEYFCSLHPVMKGKVIVK